ncbi:hypothetical protein PI87_02660 [Ralstonia sp. A12]|uniref:hypothetical protein n=1 Tax=Ralstonia sp. A12 TaxID=1217052 RepID=UPI00057398B1|nr:hypothetical protein [Ralstonia sp. A12]KHK58663.1 hypothetical protein PI87_02660 [Ralstonia sp. A12]
MKLQRDIAFPATNSDSRPLPAGQESGAYGLSNRYQGWQRAMEQAELANWFKGVGGEQEREGRTTHQQMVKAASLARPGTRARTLVSPSQEALQADNVAQANAGAQELMQPNARPVAEEAISVAEVGATRSWQGSTPQAQQVFGRTMVSQPNVTSAVSANFGQVGLGVVTPTDTAASVPFPVGLPTPLVSQLLAAMSASTSGVLDTVVVVPTRAEIAMNSPVVPGMPLQVWTGGDVQPEDVMQSLDEHESPPASGKQEATASNEDTPAVRIHAEWTEQGVRIWLGVSRDENVVLPEVQRQLDRLLAESGHQLLSLVCNGRSLTGTTQDDLAKRAPLARLHEGQYRQVLQDGDWSAGQPMFHVYQQVGR